MSETASQLLGSASGDAAARRRQGELLARLKADPILFVRSQFGVEPDAWQRDVLVDFGDPKIQRQAMKACKGPGKSTVLAWCAWQFLATRPHPKVAATSITGQNLADGLWAEMSKWQQRSPFLDAAFQWTKTRIFARESPETWWMSARQWAKSANTQAQADTLAGLHADYLLFILDESGGTPDAVMAAAEAGLATGIETRLLQAGNPTTLGGPLYRACTSERALWRLYEVTGDPDSPKRSPRISEQWAREQIAKYGRDNPWVRVNVFGEFPPASLNSLLGPDECSQAMARALTPDQYGHMPKILGVDVARFGDDRTVIYGRQGRHSISPIILRHQRTHDIAARVARLWEEWGADACFVDDTGGWGAGVIDSLMVSGRTPVGVNFGAAALDYERYFNKRAEVWFEMSDWVRQGGSLPAEVPEMISELTAPTYLFHEGRFRLEEKEQIKARLGYSPDVADALALTFAFPVTKSSASKTRRAPPGWRY